jgi:magnesium chelatase family protein
LWGDVAGYIETPFCDCQRGSRWLTLSAQKLHAVLFKIQSAALFGIDAYLVEVEVDLAQGGLGSFTTVGLPDAAVKESRERIKSAIKNCGFNFPTYQNITVNLAPADVKKEGSGFDLPMALGILGATGAFFGRSL